MLGIHVKRGEGDIGGIMYFEQLDAETLDVLLQEDFIASDMGHNAAPSAAEFLGFLQEFPHAGAGGYAVSPLRADYAVLLMSIQIDKRYMDPSTMEALQQFCQYADEKYTTPEGYCWWD